VWRPDWPSWGPVRAEMHGSFGGERGLGGGGGRGQGLGGKGRGGWGLSQGAGGIGEGMGRGLVGVVRWMGGGGGGDPPSGIFFLRSPRRHHRASQRGLPNSSMTRKNRNPTFKFLRQTRSQISPAHPRTRPGQTRGGRASVKPHGEHKGP
jgi:hypothetical protein